MIVPDSAIIRLLLYGVLHFLYHEESTWCFLSRRGSEWEAIDLDLHGDDHGKNMVP